MTLNWRNFGAISAFLFTAGLAGCAPKEPGETDSASSGSGSSSAGDSTAGASTGVTPTTGGDGHSSTGGGATETAGSETTEPGTGTTAEPGTETGGTETGSTETGGGGSAIEMACAKGCAHIFECDKDLPGTPADCNKGCVESWGGPGCGDLGVAFIECLAAMSCPELIVFLEKDEPGVCADEAEAADAVCMAGTCEMTGGGGGMMCSIGRDCGDGVQDFQCDGTTCNCVEDGVIGESCEDEGVCAKDSEVQAAIAQSCCGWDWS